MVGDQGSSRLIYLRVWINIDRHVQVHAVNGTVGLSIYYARYHTSRASAYITLHGFAVI